MIAAPPFLPKIHVMVSPSIQQESIRNSADSMLLSAPDSLFVSITKNHGFDSDELPITPTLASTTHKSRPHSFGIDGLDSLKFTYKVCYSVKEA